MATYICNACGYVYDEEKGVPEDGIKAGTKWEDVPSDWVCPLCGVGKEDFEKEEKSDSKKNGENVEEKKATEKEEKKTTVLENEKAENKNVSQEEKKTGTFAVYVCNACGYVYDEEKGDEKEGFKPGTKWEDIPEDWVCPLCGVGKEDFDKQN